MSVDPRLVCLAATALLAACPFTPMGVDPGTGSTTDATSTAPEDPTGPPPTSSSEPTTTTTGPTDGETDTTGPGPAACIESDPVHEAFKDMILRCAVDRAIEQTPDPDCMFTCKEAQALTVLDVNDLGIISTAGIHHLANLTLLNLSGNNIETLVDFHALGKLTDLYLHKNKITSTAGLEGLVSLHILLLDDNFITTLDLPPLEQLTTLTLGANQLTSLDGIRALPELYKLDLRTNAALTGTSLKLLETAAPALKELYLSGTSLKDLGDLPHIDSLLHLAMASNKLSSLSGLYEFPALTTLDLHDNVFTSLDTDDLPPLLTLLDLDDNDLTTDGLVALSQHTWMDLKPTIHVEGNNFTCGMAFEEAKTNLAGQGVTLDPPLPPCTP